MKLLLDENLPRQLKNDIIGHEVFTTAEMGWKGKENGELLSLLVEEGFDVLLTGDKNLQHQQNFITYSIPVIVLNARFIVYPKLKPLIKKIMILLQSDLPPGPTVVNED